MKYLYFVVYIVIGWFGLNACQPTAIETPALLPSESPTHPETILQTPQHANSTPVEIPPTWTPFYSAETRIGTPMPFATFTPEKVDALMPTPIYAITSVELPEDCYENSKEVEERWGKEDFLPCSDFKFSSDEQLLGFYYGPMICIRGIIILNTQTGDVIYRSRSGEGIGFEFLSNGKALVTTGHCEGGQVNLLDPATGILKSLGNRGFDILWNSAKTAFVVSSSAYHGVGGEVWGYDVERDFQFLADTDNSSLNDHPVWTPDDSHVLYQHRVVRFSYSADEFIESPEKYTFSEARQIIRVNTSNGEKQVLLSDTHYDYHFCSGPFSRCDDWHGDWVQVRRFQFEPLTVEYTGDFYYLSPVKCLLYGIGCPNPPELFALNWLTGEIVAWNQLQLMTP